jgi:hypothetical protein
MLFAILIIERSTYNGGVITAVTMKHPATVGGRNEAERGVSETVGFILIFAMILGGVTAVLVFGGPALAETQSQAELERGEHLMTLFDSRAAMVALGGSGTQTVSFGQGSGQFQTEPTEGYLAIKHFEYETGEDEEIFNKSLGAVVYENGATELAYQGGGVWRLDEQGDARMVSPPEFHYRGATLTLPVIRVIGNSSGAGSTRAQMSSSAQPRHVYPNGSATYGTTTQSYLNPIENGSVRVFVKSPYYEGWAGYFRERTSGNVTVYESNETVSLELQALGGSVGEFGMPLEGETLGVGGFADGHPINEFELTLKRDGNFNNGHWSLYNPDGSGEFEMHIWTKGKCTGSGYNDEIDFSVYYYNDSTGEVREWQNESIDPTVSSTAFDIDCGSGELSVDFTSVQTNLTYTDIDLQGTNNKWCFGDHIKNRDTDTSSPDPDINPDHHSEDSGHSFNKSSDNATMNWVINHYMSRLGTNFDLKVKDGPGNSDCLSPGGGSGSSRVDESASQGVLRYAEASGGQFITYLHVTENELNVSFE